jgi:hypothetical protein
MGEVKTFLIVSMVLATHSIFSQEDLSLMNDLPGTDIPNVESATVGGYSNPNIGSSYEVPVNRGDTASGLPVYLPVDSPTRGSGQPKSKSLEEILNSIDISSKDKLEYVPTSTLPNIDGNSVVYPERNIDEMKIQNDSIDIIRKNEYLPLILILFIIPLFYVLLLALKKRKKHFVREIKADIKNETTAPIAKETTQIILELERILELRKKGLLSKEESEDLKKRILS